MNYGQKLWVGLFWSYKINMTKEIVRYFVKFSNKYIYRPFDGSDPGSFFRRLMRISPIGPV